MYTIQKVKTQTGFSTLLVEKPRKERRRMLRNLKWMMLTRNNEYMSRKDYRALKNS